MSLLLLLIKSFSFFRSKSLFSFNQVIKNVFLPQKRKKKVNVVVWLFVSRECLTKSRTSKENKRACSLLSPLYISLCSCSSLLVNKIEREKEKKSK